MKFSIVAINFNQHNHCKLFLESTALLNYDPRYYEVIVVDDGSTPPLVDTISHRPCNVRFLYAPRTSASSRAKARNLGAGAAQGEFIVFVDGDCLVGQNLLQQYDTYFSARPDRKVAVGSYCHLIDSEVPPVISSSFMAELDNLDPYNRHDNRFRILKLNDKNLSDINPSWLLFVSRNFCICRHLFEALQGFNEQFLEWGSEDTEFAYRLIKHGERFDLIPNKVFHISRSEEHGTDKGKYLSWMRNIGIFYSIHNDPQILLLLLQEKLIHDCFCLGFKWNVEHQISTFQTIKSRMTIS